MAVVACVAAAWPAAAHAQGRINPADTYFKGYLELDKGLKIFQTGDYAGAYYKFKDASDIFDSVYATDPNWQPEIVEYRRKKTRELLEEAKQKEIERRKKVAAAKGTIRGVSSSSRPTVASWPSIRRIRHSTALIRTASRFVLN